MKLLNQIEETVGFISKSHSGSNKDPFLRSISKFLGELFDVSFVLIDKFSVKKPDIVETVVIYSNGEFLPNLKYNLKATPCENVIDKKLCIYQNNVQKLFPEDELLVQMDVDSYMGLPLWSSKGEPIGLMAILDNKQLKDSKTIELIFQIVAIKVAQALENELYENKLELQIQDLKASKEILSKSEDKFKKIFFNNPSPLYLTSIPEGKFVDVNPMFENISGYSPKEVIGKTLTGLNFYIKEEDRTRLFEELKNQDRLKNYELSFKMKNGKIRDCLINSEIVDMQGEKCLLSIVTDITEQKKAKKELRKAKEKVEKSEKKFRELYEKSGDATLIIKNGIFVNCNQATIEMLRYKSKTEFLNSHPSKLSPEFQPDGKDSKEKAEEMMAFALRNGTHRFEWMHTKNDGTVFPVEVLLTSISNEPNNKVIHVVWRDITERKQDEHKLIEAKEKAEESDRLKTEFLNNMSHEIRTPMNGILGFSNLLNDSNLSNEKRKNYISIIENSGQKLLHIIDAILEISSLETKQVKVIESQVCLNELLFELFSIFDVKAKENKTPLYLKKGISDKQITILTDKSKLTKIISNLLENSLKFTSEGFIEFGYQLKNKEIEIYVKDTGIGIELVKHESIFDRFSQVEKELSKKAGGLGIGLSLVKENVELLGGKIKLESDKGAGATFFVTIPYKPVH